MSDFVDRVIRISSTDDVEALRTELRALQTPTLMELRQFFHNATVLELAAATLAIAEELDVRIPSRQASKI